MYLLDLLDHPFEPRLDHLGSKFSPRTEYLTNNMVKFPRGRHIHVYVGMVMDCLMCICV